MPKVAARNIIIKIFAAKIENRKSNKSVNILNFPKLNLDVKLYFSLIIIATVFLNQIKTFFLEFYTFFLGTNYSNLESKAGSF